MNEKPNEELLLRRSHVVQAVLPGMALDIESYLAEREAARAELEAMSPEERAEALGFAQGALTLSAWAIRTSFGLVNQENALRVFGAVDYALAAARSLHRAGLVEPRGLARLGRIAALAAACAVRQGRITEDALGALEEYGWGAGDDPEHPELWAWIDEAQAEGRRRTFRVLLGGLGGLGGR